MLLAELDENGIAFIIGAIGIVLMQLLNAVLGYYREKDKLRRDQEILENVNTIHIATNSMKDALVAAATKAGIRQGGDEERARQRE